MLIGTQETFSGATASDGTKTGQAITATAVSTNVLDVRNSSSLALIDDGIGESPLYLVVQVSQAFNNLTSLAITLESDSTAGLGTAPVVHASKTIALAALTAGATVLRMSLPSDDFKRYVGLRYTVIGTNPTQGALHAFLTPAPQRNISYGSAVALDV